MCNQADGASRWPVVPEVRRSRARVQLVGYFDTEPARLPYSMYVPRKK